MEKVADLLNISRRNYTDKRFKKEGLEKIAIEVGAPFSDMSRWDMIKAINKEVGLDEGDLMGDRISPQLLEYIIETSDHSHSEAFDLDEG